MSVREGLEQVVVNPKVAYVVSAATTGTGVGAIWDWIPNDLGGLATLVGIVLSLVLIFTHWRGGHAKNKLSRLERKKLHLEISIIEEKEAERLETVRQRKIDGLSTRREEDSAA